MMQDWDFPHFTTTLHVNLPGFSVATLQWKYAEVDVTGINHYFMSGKKMSNIKIIKIR